MQTQTFTFSPTTTLTVAAADWALARAVDRVQNSFNLHLFSSEFKAQLLPISNDLYDLFTAIEQGRADREDVAALVVKLEAHPLRANAGVAAVIHGLAALTGERKPATRKSILATRGRGNGEPAGEIPWSMND